MAASAAFALESGEWFRRGRLLMVSPVHGDYAVVRQKLNLSSCADLGSPDIVAIDYQCARDLQFDDVEVTGFSPGLVVHHSGFDSLAVSG